MEKNSKKYYYRVYYGLKSLKWGWKEETEDSALLIEAEFQALKKHFNSIRFWAKIDDELEKACIASDIEYSAVTKRYYKKHAYTINGEGSGDYLIDELGKYLNDQNFETQEASDDEDGPYHQIECKCDAGSNGSTFFVVLTDREFLTFKQYHDSKTPLFNISTPLLFGFSTRSSLSVCIESWKESEITLQDYQLFTFLHNKHGCSVKLLEKIESWIEEAEEVELEMLPKGTIGKDEDEEEFEEEADENDEEDESEKPIEKQVKRG